MIEINLLPEELSSKQKGIVVEVKSLLYLVGLIFIILILLHTYLLSSLFLNRYQFRTLENKWNALEPERIKLEELKKDYNLLMQDAQATQEIAKAKISWSEKLNSLSLDLPAGIWFNEISWANKNFTLRASAVSLQREELNLINKFLNNLKSDSNFYKNFHSLELGAVQRKVIGGYDVVDFNLTGKLK